MKPSSVCTVVASLALLLGSLSPSASVAREWNFTALLDGKPIGSHRFVAASNALTSEARFDVKLLGVTVYRYRHRASERWSGDCLASIEARTDDGGKATEVRGTADGNGRLSIEVRNGEDANAARSTAPSACTVSFAYWNPATLAKQRALLDPGTGRVEPVRITPLTEGAIDVGGRSTPVRGLRIAGLKHPIDVWYEGDLWVGLDTTVDGGRRLTYRLQDGR